MAIQKIFSSRVKNTDGSIFVGDTGRLFYDEAIGSLRLSDGKTPGGSPIKITVTGANIGDLAITGASITSVNPNEDISIVSNGTGNVNVYGTFVVHDGPSVTPFIVSGNGYLTINTPTVPALAPGALNIVGSNDGSFQPVTAAGGMLHITGNDGTDAAATRVTIDSFNTNGTSTVYPFIAGRAARGTAASPLPLQAGDVMFRIAGVGYRNVTAYGTGSLTGSTAFQINALDNFTENTRGTEMTFSNAPLGGNTSIVCLTINTSGIITNAIQVGQSATPANNFIFKQPSTGSLSLATGDLGSPISDIFTVSPTGNVTFTGNIAANAFNGNVGLTSSEITTALGYTPVPNTRNIAGHQLTSDITLSRSDVGLSNVDNTSDATKNSASVALTNHTFNTSLNTLTIGSNLSLASYRITNLGDPSQAQDATTKNYVDNYASGFLNKITAIVATTTTLPAYVYANIALGVGDTITANIAGNLIIDTHLTSTNDYILVKNETAGNAPYNGVYKVTTAGAPATAFILTRATEIDQPAEFTGASIFIAGGNVNLATTWTCTTSLPTVGVTPIVFTQSGASISYTTGIGITLTGTQFSTDHSVVAYKADNLSVFAATSSSQLASVINDETGDGLLVFNANAALVSPSISGLVTYSGEGDRSVLSLDPSVFRQGSWGVSTSGSLYNLLGDFAMMYYSHNAPVDFSGNFAGRDEAEQCAFWVHTEADVEKTYYAPINSIGTLPVWSLKRSFDVPSGNLIISGTMTSPMFIGSSITQPAYDASTNIATTAFVNAQTELTMATVPLSGVTGGTYSFNSLGIGALINYTASAGTITTITGFTSGGSGYAIGDMITIASANWDSYIRVTGISVGGVITSVEILYGGSGYVTSTDVSVVLPTTLFTFVLTGTLTSNATILVTAGTYLTQSNQWVIANNTTGAHTVTVKMSSALNAPIGTGIVIPQGTNNSASMFIQTDGVTDVWQVTPTLTGAGANGTWGINITGIAANVTTNANLTGPITSIGNATFIAAQTGTSNVFVMNTSPTISSPTITGGSINNTVIGNVTPSIGSFTFAGVGTAATTSANLTIGGGTATVSPIVLTAGTNLTTPVAGAIEFDGTAFFKTTTTTGGRTQDSNQHIFRLTADGAAIGPAIADYFGANSAFPTTTNAVYEITWYLYYSKQTAGSVTYTITNTQAYTNIVAEWRQGTSSGIGVATNDQTAGIVATTTAAAALPTTGGLTNTTIYQAIVHCIAECGTAGNIRLRITSSSTGTVTPLRGSYYTVRRLSAGNVGTFVA